MRPLNLATVTFVSSLVTSRSNSTRSSAENSADFAGLRSTATISSSYMLAARLMMSRWPLVTESNDPGHTTRITQTHAPVGADSSGHAGAGPAARPYQSTVSPYLLDRSAAYPAGHGGGPDLASRSTTTRAPGASQPFAASRASVSRNSSSLAEYGGSANTRSRARPAAGGPRRSARAARSWTTSAPSSPTDAMFRLMTWTAPGSDSISRTSPAPRDSASSPTAPEPAYKSSTAASSSVPSAASTAENRPSLARSLVGLVARPPGTARRRPPAAPAMILGTNQAFSRNSARSASSSTSIAA